MYRILSIYTLLSILNIFPNLYSSENKHTVNLKLSEFSQISLLTCSPNDDAVYALYGHSALRVKDDSLRIDYVFDYGVFDFHGNDFVYHFVKGETDYMVVHRPFGQFYNEYVYRGSGVKEQIFDLDINQKNKIANYLFWNTLPENRVYRYNFVENNCSTKPEDIIVNSLDNRVMLSQNDKEQTYRDLFNEYLVLDPWYKMGINLVIGSYADTIITSKQKNFAPEYLYNSLEKSILQNDSVPNIFLVSKTEILLEPQGVNIKLIDYISKNKNSFNDPLFFGIIFLLLGIIVTLVKKRKRNYLIFIFDLILFSLSTIIGFIIFYLMFFSVHPCVGANWNLVWVNPFIIIFLIISLITWKFKFINVYHIVNFVAITLFFIFLSLIPQKIEVSFVPFMILLWFRSGHRILKNINHN